MARIELEKLVDSQLLCFDDEKNVFVVTAKNQSLKDITFTFESLQSVRMEASTFTVYIDTNDQTIKLTCIGMNQAEAIIKNFTQMIENKNNQKPNENMLEIHLDL